MTDGNLELAPDADEGRDARGAASPHPATSGRTTQPGAVDLPRDLANGALDRADKELDQFISKRHNARVAEEGERLLEEAWAVSERRLNARRREENLQGGRAWYTHHAELYAALAQDHASKAEGLMGGGS